MVQDSQFVNPKTGDAFQVVGVAYQPGGSAGYNPALGFDPLSNGTSCMRDAALMQMLGINSIRVYNLDPNLNHDECASIFNAVSLTLWFYLADSHALTDNGIGWYVHDA